MLPTLFQNPIVFVFYIVNLIVAVTIHEFAHAWAADKLGDPTPRLQGRLTLNPLSHLDPVGSILILLAGIGWGKPVVFDPYNLRNPRKDAAIISFAGPCTNFILAMVLSILLKLFTQFHILNESTIGSGSIYLFIFSAVLLNVTLGLFNLIPIHPLDGFKIVGGLLSRERAQEWYQLERYGLIFLLALFIPLGNGSMLDIILHPLTSFVLSLLLPGGTL